MGLQFKAITEVGFPPSLFFLHILQVYLTATRMKRKLWER